MGELLNIATGKREIVNFECPRTEPTRAIYYGVFFRDCEGKPQVAIGSLCADRKQAEMFIELRKGEGANTDYFVGTLSVPASAEEQTNA